MAKNPQIEPAPILVAVDFSDHSTSALVWAAHMSAALQVPLIVLHVVHDPESAPGYYKHSKKLKKHLHRMEEAAEEMMTEFVERVVHDHPDTPGLRTLDSRLVVGLPVTRILEMAAKTGAQMIVMGSQGRTGFAHLLLGSKAQKVAQLSPVPVTIVKHQPPSED